MINHYTANKKVRNDDAYSPGGRIGLRPDRATLPYAQRCREAFPGVPVVAAVIDQKGFERREEQTSGMADAGAAIALLAWTMFG